MGIAKLYSQSGGGGFKINGVAADYYVAEGETVNKGDFVELVETTTSPQVRKATTSDIYGVAKVDSVPTYNIIEYIIPEGERVIEGENREYNIDTVVQGDIVPKTWNDNGDGKNYTSSEGVKLSCSSISGSSYSPDKAADGKLTNTWQSSGSTDSWIKLEFPNPVKISKMGTSIQSDGFDFDFVLIQGCNDDASWATLYTTTTAQSTTELTEVILKKPDYYKYYRIYFSYPSSAKGRARVREWQVLECIETTSFTGTALQSGIAGETIQVSVPFRDIVSIYQPNFGQQFVMADGNTLVTSNGDVFLLKQA